MPASEGVSSLCIIMFTTQSAIGGIAPPKKIDKYSIIFYHILSRFQLDLTQIYGIYLGLTMGYQQLPPHEATATYHPV